MLSVSLRQTSALIKLLFDKHVAEYADWHKVLPLAQLWLNSHVHTSAQLSAFSSLAFPLRESVIVKIFQKNGEDLNGLLRFATAWLPFMISRDEPRTELRKHER